MLYPRKCKKNHGNQDFQEETLFQLFHTARLVCVHTPVLKRISIAKNDLELRLCQHFEPLISESKYHSFEIFQLGLFEKMNFEVYCQFWT